MGILNSNEITPATLLARGFEVDGWGSPSTRKSKNTTMFELIFSHRNIFWIVAYFPPEFEGQVVPAGCFVMDMRGKVMMQHATQTDRNVYIIDATDMNDIETFIHQVLAGKVKPFNSYEHTNRERRTRTKRYNAS